MYYQITMPSRNVLKQDAPDSYYHVYARGNSRRKIFVDEADYKMFLKLLRRYLAAEEAKNAVGISYPNFYNKLELLCFCLMPNHLHLLLYQHQQGAMTELMRSLLTSYSMYFNKKYKRSGSLFESRFKASRISTDSYLEHITRYIHLNPREWRTYEYSSLQYFLHQNHDTWIRPARVVENYSSGQEYIKFMEDYEENKNMLDILKDELANEA